MGTCIIQVFMAVMCADRVPLGYEHNAICFCRWIPTFRKNMLQPFLETCFSENVGVHVEDWAMHFGKAKILSVGRFWMI
jgi:hypothetical protein